MKSQPERTNPKYIIKALIPRRYAVLKLGREELEIVTARPHAVTVVKATRL
jgi:hypothetical protein